MIASGGRKPAGRPNIPGRKACVATPTGQGRGYRINGSFMLSFYDRPVLPLGPERKRPMTTHRIVVMSEACATAFTFVPSRPAIHS